MTRDLIDALFRHAEEMRRAWNKKGEDLGAPDPWEEIETVHPCSETTAVIVCRKASGMRVVVFAFWVKIGGGRWCHFFPTYEHLYGFQNDRLYKTMDKVEEQNAEIRRRDWQDRPDQMMVI